jgi:hypothetical protein
MQKSISLAALSALIFAFAAAMSYPQSSAIIATGKRTIAQVPSPLSIEVEPASNLPIGESAQWFSSGGSVDLGVNYIAKSLGDSHCLSR